MNKRPVYPLPFGLILLPLPQIHPSSLVLPQKKVATTTPNDGARCGVRTALPFGRTSRTTRGSGRGELSGRRPSPGGYLTPALRADGLPEERICRCISHTLQPAPASGGPHGFVGSRNTEDPGKGNPPRPGTGADGRRKRRPVSGER